ncbi:MAG: insulinase family protein [Acidobacteria bacterium]|nr:insulinase family protein [Acidobacteriota bacterium]
MPADRSRLPEVGPDPPFRFPAIVRHRLANGLDVRTIEHHTVPVVSCVLQIQGGAGGDPPGEEGLAAITADMVDEGTGHLSAIDVSEGFARLGAEYDVEVGPDATLFSLTVLSRFAERGLSLLADILARPSLRGHDFERVRKLRLDRLRQLKDLPPAVAERAFLRLVYGDHPYGHLPIGTEAALRACRVERVAEFHAAAFSPARATLVLAGPLAHETLRALVAAAFSRWADDGPDGAAATAAAIDPPTLPRRLAIVPRAGAAQSELRIGHLSARRNTPDYAALLLMNAVLGGQFVSRINLRLREEKGYTYGARTGFDWRRGPAPFALQASVHTAATADAIRDTLAEFDAIRGARPPSDEEMALARASLTRGYPRNFETAEQVARSVAQLALYDLPDSYFQEFVPRVNAVERSDVVRAAERYVDAARATTLIVGDYQAIGESLPPLGYGEPQILPPDE